MSKFLKIIEQLNSSQKEILDLQESILPSVGIFYFIDGTIELQNLNLPLGKIKNKTIDELKSILEHLGFYVMPVDNKVYIGYNSLHINMFKDIIKRIYPSVKNYNDIPRGRIMYNVTDDQFECLMDKCLDNDHDKKLIKKEFNISNLNFNFDDKNYICLECK